MTEPIRVLIADDEPQIAELLALELQDRGITSTRARTAEEAVAAARRDLPDLILLDMTLPRRPREPEHPDAGVWAVKELRAAPATAEIPIIAVTGHTEAHKVARFRAAGCADVVGKPPDYELLHDRILRYARRASPVTVPPSPSDLGSALSPVAMQQPTAAADFLPPRRASGPDPSPPGSLREMIDAPLEDERRRELSSENREYATLFSDIRSSVLAFLGSIARLPKAGDREKPVHDLVNEATCLQYKLRRLRSMEQQALFDGMDDWVDRLEHAILDAAAAAKAGRTPAAAASPPEPRAVSQAPPRPVHARGPASGPGCQAGTILVADDQAGARGLVAEILKEDGHWVFEAEDGGKVIERIRDCTPDLLILDLDMPVFTGLEVLEQVKGHPRWRRIPVLMVSGSHGGEASDELRPVVQAIRMGAVDYLAKPVDETLLRVRVNATLERERLRRAELEGFFSPEVVEAIERDPELLTKPLAGVEVTILVCDIRGFSRLTGELAPGTMFRWLNAVMDKLTECVLAEGGTVVNYVGDEILAMWGAPRPQADHAARACAAARRMLDALPGLNATYGSLFKGGGFEVGIGLNSGPVHVGNTGSAKRKLYGPLGGTVNLASRVQGATKYIRTNAVITGATREKIGNAFPTRRLGKVRTVNINRDVDLYELLDESDADAAGPLRDGYEQALAAFEAGPDRLQDAIARLGTLIPDYPKDGPSLVLLSRAVQMQLGVVPYDPVWELPGK